MRGRMIAVALLACLLGIVGHALMPEARAFPTVPEGSSTFSSAIAASGGTYGAAGIGFTSDPGAGLRLSAVDTVFFEESSNGNQVSLSAFGVRIFGLNALQITANDAGTKFESKTYAAATAANIADPGHGNAIPVTFNGVCNMTSGASGQTRSIVAPTFEGQVINLTMDVDGGGDIVVTVSAAYDQTPHTTITFNDAGDWAQLVGVRIAGALRWRLVNQNGCTLG